MSSGSSTVINFISPFSSSALTSIIFRSSFTVLSDRPNNRFGLYAWVKGIRTEFRPFLLSSRVQSKFANSYNYFDVMQSSNYEVSKTLNYLLVVSSVPGGPSRLNFPLTIKEIEYPGVSWSSKLMMSTKKKSKLFLSISHLLSGYSVLITSWIYSSLKNYVSAQS